MKTLMILFLSLMLMVACSDSTDDCEDGSGNYVEFARLLDDFTSVSLAGAGNIFISKGELDTVKVVTDDNMVDNIILSVAGGKLSVRPKDDKCPTKMDVYVTVSEINDMDISGAGDIVLLEEFETDNCSFEIEGAGDINLPGIIANDISFMISGSGKITASGSAKNCQATLAGSGTIDLADLVCENVNATLAGSGNIRVNSTISMTASIAGSGNIYYKYTGNGNPVLTISGSGSVIPL
jgi:hypothetical protein